MQNMGLLMEYEDILLKKRKDFSANIKVVSAIAQIAIIFLFLDAHRDLKLSLRIHFLFFTLILLSPEYVHPQFLLCDPQVGRFPRCG